jgi:hypothetical protein
MLKAVVVKTWKQHVGIGVIQSFNAGITTTRVETIIAPNINVVRRGLKIEYVAKLGNISSGVLVVRNLSRSLTLPIITIKIISIPQMVFTNLITIFMSECSIL